MPKGFSQHSKGQKKKNVQVSSMTRLNEHSPLIMPGCIMSPRHTFTNKQHCWSVNIHYYYADSNVTVLQPHHSLADMPVTDRDPRAHTPSDEAMVTWFCHLHCVRVLKGKKSIVSILYKGLQYLQVTCSGLLKSKLIFFFFLRDWFKVFVVYLTELKKNFLISLKIKNQNHYLNPSVRLVQGKMISKGSITVYFLKVNKTFLTTDSN